jgi:membrane protein involved in colicin uptake
MKHRESGNISLPLYIVIGIILCGVFLGTLFAVKQYSQGGKTLQVTQVRETPDEEAAKKQQEKAERAAEEAALESKKAAEAKKVAEENAKKEQAPATQNATPATAEPAPAPQKVASTGPEDAVIGLVGVLSLSYASYRFVISRKELAQRLQGR